MNGAILFDIPAQPLAGALEAYGRTVGMAALADQALVADRRSAGVKGMLTNDQALRILLAGTGLSVRYVSRDAFTLEPTGAADAVETAHAVGGGADADHRGYFADLQASLIRLLCRRPETQPGRFRLGLQLWIGPDGAVLASHLLDPLGDDRRAVVMAGQLKAAFLAPPPPDLPQPVTVVLLPRASEQTSDCPDDGGHPG